MATLVNDCPHCSSSRMAFLIVGARAVRGSGRDVGNGLADNRQATVGLQCQACLRGAAATVRNSERLSVASFNTALASLNNEGVSIPGGHWSWVSFWPEKTPARIPDFLPEVVERAFSQGETNLALEDHCEAAATMFRRALDLALKIKHPDLKGDLNKKIIALAESHDLPKSLAEWAHEVRGIGNDGAHDLDGCSQEDAQAARDFVDAVLRYIFSMPGLIEARRPKAADPHAEGADVSDVN